MGFQYRNGIRYYTRSRRVNGRVEREYVGSGLFAEEAARDDLAARQVAKEEKEREQELWRREREALAAIDEIVEVVREGAQAALRTAMEATGYQQHARGEWRKKRREKQDEDGSNEKR